MGPWNHSRRYGAALPDPIYRPAVRVLLLDEQDRALLGLAPAVPWRAVTTEPVYRPAVRVLLLDEHDRTLLLRYRNPQGEVYWVPPGGGLEDGEDHPAAARRELAEELGLGSVDMAELGWRRRVVVPWQGTTWDQDERWFMARCEAAEVERGLDADRRAFLATEGVSEVRWWTLGAIRAAEGVHFAPDDLADRLPAVLGQTVRGLAGSIASELRAAGTPERAAKERAYLKSDLEHYGTSMPAIRHITKQACREHGPLGHAQVVALAEALWAEPVHERRAAAVEVLALARRHLVAADLALVERLVRQAKTWGLVDPLATSVAGDIVARDPDGTAATLDRWAGDGDFWVRRSALLTLLPGLRTGGGDFDRFGRYADAMLDEKEFFIRKAIGWVLREVSKRTPGRVAAWLAPRTHRASGVTMREAVKYLPEPTTAELMAAYRERRRA